MVVVPRSRSAVCAMHVARFAWISIHCGSNGTDMWIEEDFILFLVLVCVDVSEIDR